MKNDGYIYLEVLRPGLMFVTAAITQTPARVLLFPLAHHDVQVSSWFRRHGADRLWCFFATGPKLWQQSHQNPDVHLRPGSRGHQPCHHCGGKYLEHASYFAACLLTMGVVPQLHPCGGTGQQWFSGTRLPSFADQNGFILIYPSTPNQSNCWDVHNPASLTHNGGGDAGGIISMVNYTLDRYNGNREKVYVMGFSSGGMMTNVMAGSYPEVFEAGAAYSGTAHACFAGTCNCFVSAFCLLWLGCCLLSSKAVLTSRLFSLQVPVELPPSAPTRPVPRVSKRLPSSGAPLSATRTRDTTAVVPV